MAQDFDESKTRTSLSDGQVRNVPEADFLRVRVSACDANNRQEFASSRGSLPSICELQDQLWDSSRCYVFDPCFGKGKISSQLCLTKIAGNEDSLLSGLCRDFSFFNRVTCSRQRCPEKGYSPPTDPKSNKADNSHQPLRDSVAKDAVALVKIFGGILLGSLIFFLAGGWYWKRGPLDNRRAFLSLTCSALLTGLLALALLSI